MIRFWSVGLRRRGWFTMQGMKNMFMLSQLRFFLMKELLDKNWFGDDTAVRYMGGK